MPTPAEIIDMVASLQNDTAQTFYTDAACLPYLDMALDELQEHFENNGVPTVEESSDIITLTAGVTELGYGTNPALPGRLVEIINIWESISGQNNFFRMTKEEFLPHYLEGTQQAYFERFVWQGERVKMLPALNNIDLKIDYYGAIWNTPLDINLVNNQELNVRNSKQFLGYRTAALCSAFIGENETRAAELNMLAESALSRTLGIKIKPKQGIVTKRRPFRARFKLRSYY